MTVVQRSPTAGIHAPKSSFPRRRESTAGAGDGFPSPRERRWAAGAPTIVIPAGGNPRRWVPLSTGRRWAAGAPHNRHSRDGGNPRRGADDAVPQRGAGDGFPSPGGGERRESTAVSTGAQRRTHNRHSRDGGNPQRGAGDGFPSPPERRWAAAHHNRHSRDGGNPQRGAGDGFPSPPERRWAAGAHTIVIPATAGIHRGGGRRWVPLSTGTTVGGGAHTIVIPATAGIHTGGRRSLGGAAAPNRYRGGRGRARRRTCDTMTSAGIDGRSTRRRPAAPTLVGSMQPAAQRTCQS